MFIACTYFGRRAHKTIRSTLSVTDRKLRCPTGTPGQQADGAVHVERRLRGGPRAKVRIIYRLFDIQYARR